MTQLIARPSWIWGLLCGEKEAKESEKGRNSKEEELEKGRKDRGVKVDLPAGPPFSRKRILDQPLTIARLG